MQLQRGVQRDSTLPVVAVLLLLACAAANTFTPTEAVTATAVHVEAACSSSGFLPNTGAACNSNQHCVMLEEYHHVANASACCAMCTQLPTATAWTLKSSTQVRRQVKRQAAHDREALRLDIDVEQGVSRVTCTCQLNCTWYVLVLLGSTYVGRMRVHARGIRTVYVTTHFAPLLDLPLQDTEPPLCWDACDRIHQRIHRCRTAWPPAIATTSTTSTTSTSSPTAHTPDTAPSTARATGCQEPALHCRGRPPKRTGLHQLAPGPVSYDMPELRPRFPLYHPVWEQRGWNRILAQ